AVGVRPASPGRGMPGHAGDAHEAAHPLGDRVVAGTVSVGARLSEAADRDVHDARVRGPHGLVADAQSVGHAGDEVLNEDIGAGSQVAEESRAVRMLEIERDSPLVAVDGGEDGTHAPAPRAGPPLPQAVAALATLH